MRVALSLAFTIVLLLPSVLPAQEPPSEEAEQASSTEDSVALPQPERANLVEFEPSEQLSLLLSPEHERWLTSVAPLITEEERQYFLSIGEEYRREAFIDKFWEVRDPDPRTRFNELRFRWEEHLERRPVGVAFDDARSMLFLLHGEPGGWALADGRVVGRCFAKSTELEIWFYGASEVTGERFLVILVKPGPAVPYEYWFEGMSLRTTQRSQLPTRDISQLCADELLPMALKYIREDINYSRFLEDLSTPSSPDPEWLATFAAITTEIPDGSQTFDVTLEVDFPGRNQNRTAVQGVLAVRAEEAGRHEFDGKVIHQFVVVGEILRNDSLFELFRYRYELPFVDEVELVPLVFTRYLRSGPARFRVRVQDVFSQSYGRVDLDVEVPSAIGRDSVRPLPQSPVFKLLREASAAAARGERALRLIPPQEGSVHVGMVRFETQAVGDFDQVTFFLDDRPILTKRSQPFSVELNLGSMPSTHRLRVVGMVDGAEAAVDEIRVNQGGQRFRVHVTEPRSDRKYESSVAAMVQVEVPDGETIDRVELYLSEERIATLYQRPYVQSVLLPGGDLVYIRAVAFLEDGSSTEDVVFVNAPAYLEEVEVQYVELHALVLDGGGRPILGLEEDSFTIKEDGREQTIKRFEWVKDLPIHAGLLIDTSASMEDSLETVRSAALRFAESAIEEKDRICLLSFSSQPHVEVRFTNEVSQIERALLGLRPEGSTALYDSLVYALTYFDGVKGQKALLLLSDGKDENSAFDFEATLEVARRSGVIVYAIGLKDASREKSARKTLQKLADQTGGRAYFVDDLSELKAIYAAIEEELRSRYLLAYQSTSTKDPSEFRSIGVDVDRRDVEVRTLAGYYP